MDYATYIGSLWESKDIALLYRELANVPNHTFYVSGANGNTIKLDFNMINDLLRYYNNGDITATFKHIQQHWGNEVHLQMPDGRTIVNDQNAFIDIYTTNRAPKNSGLKFHLPVHVNDVNKMEVIMKKMYNINPNFMYKYAPNGLGGNQVGKVLTIYADEGLDTPETLHKFTKQLLSEMQQYGIRTYSPADLKRTSSNPNLLNDKVEWQVKGAEGKIYYSYDGNSENGYRGNLKYNPNVNTAGYVRASDGDRRPYKAINDPFEYEVDLNYDHPRTAYNNNSINPPNQNPPQRRVLEIGEGMGDAAQENVRELYRRALQEGLNPGKSAFSDQIPSSYRLTLNDTPEAWEFIRRNLSPDGRSIINNRQNPPQQRVLEIGEGMGDAAQENVRELYRRALQEGLNPNKSAFSDQIPSSYRLTLNDTPEAWEFIRRNLSPDGRSIVTNPHTTPSNNNKPNTQSSFSDRAKQLQEALNKGITGARQTAAATAEKINRGIQSARQIQTRLTQAAVARIGALPGGTRALQAARTVSNVGSKAAGPLVLLSAALDPKGSREFVDDVVNLRVGKIASETWEGTTQMVLHPVDTAQAMYDMASDAVRNRYKNAETVGDYVAETGRAAGKGFLNIGDTVWGSVSSIKTAQARSINWLLQKSGVNTQIATDTLSYEAYKRDPIAFLGNLVVPTTVNTETGLRSDDDLMSLISRDNPKALEAYIATGKEDVNRNIQGSYHGNNHTPYNTALQFAVASGNMKVARVLYQQNGVNYNGKNSSTWETTVMTLLRHNAPDQDEPSFLTGKPTVSEFSDEGYAEYMTTQAMIDDLILNKKIDLNAVNFAGQDTFLVAAESGNVTTATLCLGKGSNINRTALNGWNALHYCHHNQEMVSMLLEQGIDANQANKRGETALMFSLEGKPTKRNTNSVSMLLLASNEEGLNRLKASPKHLKLLDKLMEEHPASKDIILGMEGHPLQAFFKERYPDEATAYEAQLAQENNSTATPSNTQNNENSQPVASREDASSETRSTDPKSTQQTEPSEQTRTGDATQTLAQNAQAVPNETNDTLAQTRADQATR